MTKYLATVICHDVDIYITSLDDRRLELVITGPSSPSWEQTQLPAELTRENVDELLGVLTEWRNKKC